jgi:hypothetical protein
MNLTTFDISADEKHPINTIGVYGEYYFGTIDGVEIGSPCLTYQDAVDDVKNMMTRVTPYSIEELLQEDIEWHGRMISKLNGKRDTCDLELSLIAKSKLLKKVVDFKFSGLCS